MPFGIQPYHILIIIVVALLVFGPKRLPEIGRNLGKAINEFRNGTREFTDIIRDGMNTPGDAGAANNVTATKTSSPTPTASVPVRTPSIAPVRAGNFCIQCGAQNPPEARFCNQCGAKLPEKTIYPSDPAVPRQA